MCRFLLFPLVVVALSGANVAPAAAAAAATATAAASVVAAAAVAAAAAADVAAMVLMLRCITLQTTASSFKPELIALP